MKMNSRSHYDTCIESFPDEILIEIFTYLTASELKQILMTNQVFRDIVARSSMLMKKFLLKISPKRKFDFESLTRFKRIHQNAKLLDFKAENESLELVIEGLWNIGENVKCFELSDCEISKENLSKVFRSMGKLEKVDLLHTKVSLETIENPPKFMKLKVLKVIESDVFDVFEKAVKLQEISLQTNDRNDVNLQSFEQLLMRQKKLKCLKLLNIKFSNFLEERKTFPFQLSSLIIQHCHVKEKENLESFLSSQKCLNEVELTIDNLKLNLDRLRYFEESLAIVFVMKNLRKVSIVIENYNFTSMKFLHQIINPNVDHLSLNIDKSLCDITSILRIFPNIKFLEISTKEMTLDNVMFINENLQNLKQLKVSTFPKAIFSHFKVKNLTTLHVNETNLELENWTDFLENNQNITKLIINFTFFTDLSEDFVDKITRKLTKLEHVELIDKWIGMKNEIYQVICENCKNLRYLKLWNINVEKNFEELDKEFLRKRNIKFHIYNDESLNCPMIPF